MQTLACLQHYLYVCVCACWWRGDLCEAVCRSSVCVDERECVICSGVLASSACWQKGISSSAWRCPSDSCSLLFSPLHLFSFSSLFLCRSRCLAPSPLCPLCRQKAGITAPPGKMLCIILYSPFLAAFTATNMMCMLSIIQAGGKKENSQEKKCRLSFFLLLLFLVWLCVWSLISISLGIILFCLAQIENICCWHIRRTANMKKVMLW